MNRGKGMGRGRKVRGMEAKDEKRAEKQFKKQRE